MLYIYVQLFQYFVFATVGTNFHSFLVKNFLHMLTNGNMKCRTGAMTRRSFIHKHR